MNPLQIITQLKNYVDEQIILKGKQEELRTTNIKPVKRQYQFTTEYINSEYEDWYDLTIIVGKNFIEVGDKSEYITVDTIEQAKNEINNYLF